MDWQNIILKDPFLAGALAVMDNEAKGPEQVADEQNLTGDKMCWHREKFIAGWNFELEESARKAKR